MINIKFLCSGAQFITINSEKNTSRKSKYERLEQFYNKGLQKLY